MTIKVCPNCGTERFRVVEYSSRTVILDGNRNHFDYLNESEIDELSNTMECTGCDHNYTEDDLVTESEFHEVISNKECKDNALHFMTSFTDKQRHLMWRSQVTLYEDTSKMYHVIKDREKRFSGIAVVEAENMFESETRTLIVYKDGTHKANFSL